MDDDELVKVFRWLSDCGEGAIYIPQDIDHIQDNCVYNLILLFLQGNKKRIRIYAQLEGLGAWSYLCKTILNIPPVITKDSPDWECLILLKEKVRRVIDVIITGSYELECEEFCTAIKLPFEDYMPELISLYESLLPNEDDNHYIVELLKSDNPLGTFINLCTVPNAYYFYIEGVRYKYFPRVTWDVIKQVVDKYYGADLIDKDKGHVISCMIETKDLEDDQLAYLLSKGCTNSFLYEALKRGNIPIPNEEEYKEEIKKIQGWIYNDKLVEQYSSIESIATNWYSLSRKDRKYLYEHHEREFIQVGESPVRISAMNLALVQAGIHEVNLVGRLPKYYYEEDVHNL